MGDIVVDSDGEVIVRRRLGKIVKDGLDHGRGEFLGGQSVAAADNAGHGGDFTGGEAFGQGGQNLLVERFAERAGFLGAVQHGDGAHGGGQRGEEMLDGEGTEQADLENADLFSLG